MTRTACRLLLLVLVSLPAPLGAQLMLAPCTIDGVDGEAQCGTYRVFEDRPARSGRTIPLNLVVLRARTAGTGLDPLFVLQGGPGQGVAQLADFYGRIFGQVRVTRDIVLLDLRGTCRSNLLDCPQLGAPDTARHFDDQLLAPAAVAACATVLAARADLTKYTTEAAMADLDEVRGALGYERINLYGTSYGSYAAQTYMSDFPHRVRTVSMKGVVPHGQVAPVFHARDSERAWRALVARCNSDAACHKHYPTLDRDLRATMAKLSRDPVTVPVSQPAGRATISISVGLFGEVVRNLLYSPENAARLPSLVRQAAAGDWSAIAPLALRTRTTLAGPDLAAGFFLSVTCAEGAADLSPQTIAEVTSGTFAGDYRLQQQARACARWPRAQVSASRRAPIVSNIPVLMFSGELDPVTPPTRGADALTYLTGATHVVVANNGHPFGKLEGCGNVIIARFIEAATMEGIDTSCARSLPPVPFVVPAAE